MGFRIKRFLGIERLHPDVQFFLDCSNLRLSRACSIIVMCLETITFTISFFFQVHEEVNNPQTWIFHHRLAYIILFLAALQLCIYSFSHKPEKGKFSHFKLNLSIGIFLFVILIFSMYISLLDYTLGEQIMVFISLELFVASLYIIRPYISFPVIICTFSIFYFLMLKYKGATSATNVNYPILGLLFLVVSESHYLQYLRIAKRTVMNHSLVDQLRQASLFDPLTKLKNRNALRMDFDSVKNSSLLLMLTDIDDFKSYNDTYGHNYGDDLLARFGMILQETFGEEFCYRYGGDEFLVMIPNISEEDFKVRVEKCRMIIGNDFRFSGGFIIEDVNSLKEIHSFINRADMALYQAKRNGKNQILRDGEKV